MLKIKNHITKIVVTGAAGKMAQTIIHRSSVNNIIGFGFELVGAIENRGSVWLGRDALNLANKGKEGNGSTIIDDLKAVIPFAEAVIDFTAASATQYHLKLCIEHNKAIVIGSTGHSDDEKKFIRSCSKNIPIVYSSNMSVGVNVMWKIIADAAKLLGDGFDVEIVEAHHRLKKDAPSGTAMTTAEVLANALGRDLEKDAVYHREGLIGERKPNEIGIQTLRGGDVVGDHTVFFFGNGERLEVTHRATSRDTFALGALRAAKWVVKQKPGLYSMRDVLGLT